MSGVSRNGSRRMEGGHRASLASVASSGFSQDLADMTTEELEILQQKFPLFHELEEICDCGRHKSKKDRPKVSNTTALEKSHYQHTFQAFPDARPSTTVRPPRGLRDPNPPPMNIVTQNDVDFGKPPSFSGRAKIIRPEAERYTPPKEPFKSSTVYKETFPGYNSFPVIEVKRPATQHKPRGSGSAKFDDRTAHRDHFKRWVPQPTIAYGELPSFTGSILFPGNTLGESQSVTQKDYPGYEAKMREPCKIGEGTLKMEGDVEHLTTHKQTYRGGQPKGDRVRIVRHKEQWKTDKRAQFRGETQAMRDYAGFKSQPLPPKAFAPAPATLTLSADNKVEFVTEQRTQFRNFETSEYPKIYRKEPETYQAPDAPFETFTSNKTDYTKHDLKSAHVDPVIQKPNIQSETEPLGRFDDRTMNKKFFKDWGVQPRIRYGDFHARPFVPPHGKIEGNTVTNTTFTPKKWEPVNNYKPVQRALSREGEQEFSTIHKDTFVAPNPQMCRAKAWLIQQELKKRRKVLKSHKHSAASHRSPAGKNRGSKGSRNPKVEPMEITVAH